MENLSAWIYSRFAVDPTVTGVLIVRTARPYRTLVDGFDALLLVVTKDTMPTNYINHYSRDGLALQERRISKDALQQWIITGENRSIIEWIIQGEICLDKDTFLEATRHRLLEFPKAMKEQKLFIEFSLFLRRYQHSKQYLKEGQALDAFTNVLEALVHWARIVIIEQGLHPEVTVWQQVRKLNPGIYKLYEELTLNSETLEQRVELIHLACEFNVLSKMANFCAILIRVLESREKPFSPYELKYHPELCQLHVDMAMVLRKLVKRGLIREVITVGESAELDALEVLYTSMA